MLLLCGFTGQVALALMECPDLGVTVLCGVTGQVALPLMEWDHV